jgi:dolichol-phosphate mannosyltransferase
MMATSMSELPQVEVLLPVHNEDASIAATIHGMAAVLSRTARIGFIICEDGSRDDTQAVLRGLAAELAADLTMRLNMSAERKGYSRAMREGMAMAEAEYLLCLDSDGQCDPADFAAFWAARHQADIVLGWRVERADTRTRRLFSGIFHLLYRAAFRVPVHDPSCPFVLMPRAIAHQMAADLGAMREGFWWEFCARAHRLGCTIVELPIQHRQRAAGVTQVYKWKKMPGIFLRHVGALWTIHRQTAGN